MLPRFVNPGTRVGLAVGWGETCGVVDATAVALLEAAAAAAAANGFDARGGPKSGASLFSVSSSFFDAGADESSSAFLLFSDGSLVFSHQFAWCVFGPVSFVVPLVPRALGDTFPASGALTPALALSCCAFASGARFALFAFVFAFVSAPSRVLVSVPSEAALLANAPFRVWFVSFGGIGRVATVCVAGLAGAKDIRRRWSSTGVRAALVACCSAVRLPCRAEVTGVRWYVATSAVRTCGVGIRAGDVPVHARAAEARAGFFAEVSSSAAASSNLPRCWPAHCERQGRRRERRECQAHGKEATARTGICTGPPQRRRGDDYTGTPHDARREARSDEASAEASDETKPRVRISNAKDAFRKRDTAAARYGHAPCANFRLPPPGMPGTGMSMRT